MGEPEKGGVCVSDYFIYGGVDSRTFGAYVYDVSSFNAPVQEYEPIPVPGRNGDLLMKQNRFSNISHIYSIVIPSDFETNYERLRNYLMSKTGYNRLEDSLHPDEFYQAYLSTEVAPIISRDRDMGKLQIEFMRKPQRFLKSGEQKITITESGTNFTNPTKYAAEPLLDISGTVTVKGSLWVSGQTIYISRITDNLSIDFALQEAYKDNLATSWNQYVEPVLMKYLPLESGNNFVGWNMSGITQVEVTPRWWTL